MRKEPAEEETIGDRRTPMNADREETSYHQDSKTQRDISSICTQKKKRMDKMDKIGGLFPPTDQEGPRRKILENCGERKGKKNEKVGKKKLRGETGKRDRTVILLAKLAERLIGMDER